MVTARGNLETCTFLDQVDAVVVAVGSAVEGDDELQPRAGTVAASTRYGIDLGELAERAAFTARAGTTHTIDLPRVHTGSMVALPWAGLAQRIIFVGVGTGTQPELRQAGAALAKATVGLGRVVTPLGADGATGQDTRAVVEGYLLAAYLPPKFGDAVAERRPAEQLVLLGDAAETAIEQARRAAWATWLVRDLAAIPANFKNPGWFAEHAVALAKRQGLETSVLGVDGLREGGFGGILAVGGGSVDGPRLVTITYTPSAVPDGATKLEGADHIVLVGKGITYDTGGLSIKPREAMVPMKTDMAGAAVALAAVLGAAQAESRHTVTALLPLAENHVSGLAYRPGDVLMLHGGTTVEIANTDAEGRLVLADAMAYADAELEPDLLIDIATLTGAASVGLGRGHAALFTSDAALLAGLTAAAVDTGEQVWPMPLVEDYTDALDSSVADLRQVPAHPAGGGAITAALFLRSFAGNRRWAHLDIAGPSRASSAAHEVPKGPTGYGARLLLAFLDDLS